MPNVGEATGGPTRTPPASPLTPAYGQIVCFCERVTAGEIRDTFSATIPPTTFEGLR
jgi:glycerol-3-phosphate dehydrogenase